MSERMEGAGSGPARVLVAVDGSAPSRLAVDLVADRPWPPGTMFRVIEAVGIGPGVIGGPWSSVSMSAGDDLDTAVRSEARRRVETARQRLEGPGRLVSATVESGRTADVIVDEARAMAADLIAIGSRGRGTIASMVLGSVSAEVLEHAPAPVLVARGTRLERVMLAWDESECAAGALAAVRDWPILVGLETRVVAVAETMAPWWAGVPDPGASSTGATEVVLEVAERSRDAARTMVAAAAAELGTQGRSVTTEVREGDPAAELIEAARAFDADLIVLGSHGRSGVARLRLGSVASSVSRHASCSVLVIRSTETAEVDGNT